MNRLFRMTPYRWALASVAMLAIALLWWGITLLAMPPVYKLIRAYSPLLYYQGHLLVALAATLLVFHRWVARTILWASQEIHRIASALIMVAVLGIDGMMHMFNIPHMEGWWLPLFGSGAAISVIGGWLHKLRRRSAE